MSPPDKSNRRIYAWLEIYDKDRMEGLERCRSDRENSERSWREANCETIALISEFIRDVNKTPDLRNELFEHEFFRNDPRGPRKTSAAVGRFVLNVQARSGADYELARSYGDLADYFASVEKEPQEVADELMRIGIAEFWRRIKDAEEEEENDQPVEKAPVHDRSSDDPIFGVDLAGAEDEGKSPRAVARGIPGRRAEIVTKALAKEPTSKPKRPKFNPETMIMVGGLECHRVRVLATKANESVTVKLRCRITDDLAWKTLLIEEVIDGR